MHIVVICQYQRPYASPARYSAAGVPSPPRPIISTCCRAVFAARQERYRRAGFGGLTHKVTVIHRQLLQFPATVPCQTPVCGLSNGADDGDTADTVAITAGARGRLIPPIATVGYPPGAQHAVPAVPAPAVQKALFGLRREHMSQRDIRRACCHATSISISSWVETPSRRPAARWR